MTINAIIADLCHDADHTLWGAYAAAKAGRIASLQTGHLLFPLVRGGQACDLRVSEQEARFAFLEAVIRRGLRYAVEVPTDGAYQFTGNSCLSAQTDLAVYRAEGTERISNVEFKAKGISAHANNMKHIYKDFQKLLRERHVGVWYHVLESVDNSTIRNLVEVMNTQVDKVYRNFPQGISAPHLIVHVCVLRHGFSLHIDMATCTKPMLPEVDMLVARDKIQAVNSLNGWSLNRH